MNGDKNDNKLGGAFLGFTKIIDIPVCRVETNHLKKSEYKLQNTILCRY